VHARRGQQGAAMCGEAAAQWRAAVGTPASGNQPLGAVQTLANVTNSNTPGAVHGPLGPPVPQRARAERVRPLAWHAHATSRVSALWRSRGGNGLLKQFSS
jgi:hypothetical protein